MTKLWPLVAASSLLCALGVTRVAGAADCGCDHSIALGETGVDGKALGVAPGDVVCIAAGQRPFLVLEDIVGTEAEPVTIKNCGGQVRIENSDKGYGINVLGSAHFRLTGSGEPGLEYGFDVSASRTGPSYAASGVSVGGLSTDYEIDHVEVHHTGFAGFSLKTESRCDGSANLGNFVQRNTRVHHTFVHDVGGEGFYVGSTGYGGRDFECDGQTVKLFPHEHHGVYLYENRIENSGWDGLQVGVTPKDCEIHDNVIIGVGKTADDLVQTRGIQIGGASACNVHGNYLADGPTIGIFILGAADTRVFNNVVTDFAEQAIYANDQKLDAVTGSSYVFAHNTIVRAGGGGLSLFGSLTTGNVVINNLLVEAEPLNLANGSDVVALGNLELSSSALAGFVNAEAADHHLTAESPARDQGAVMADLALDVDRDGVPRDEQPDVGAYEYTTAPPPPPATGGSGGSGGSSQSADPSEPAAASCACSAPGRGGQSLGALALLLGLYALTRSRPRGH